jgi:hypothetical protein
MPMAKDYIGYETLADDAMRGVVREALRRVVDQGLIGSHHFYLTFKTHDPGVDIPDHLKERFPEEMTIVLQNQFWGLKVEDKKFEVTLTFQKLPSTLVVPFAAMTGFADPAVKFGLQFRNASPQIATGIKGVVEELKQPAKVEDEAEDQAEGQAGDQAGDQAVDSSEVEKANEADQTASGESQIVSLDQFRKK